MMAGRSAHVEHSASRGSGGGGYRKKVGDFGLVVVVGTLGVRGQSRQGGIVRVQAAEKDNMKKFAEKESKEKQ